LADLAKRYAETGSPLILRRGDTLDQLVRVATEARAKLIHCTRAYEPRQIALEERLHAQLAAAGITLRRFGGRLLCEPEEVKTKDGKPYRVYTPFWRALSAAGVTPALPAITKLAAPKARISSEALDGWRLLPRRPDWAGGLRKAWRPGETAARVRLEKFLDNAVADYAEKRNRPDIEGTSRLSPHLHFGEISPRQCWHAAALAAARAPRIDAGVTTFLKELVWREFSHHLLFHFSDLPEAPFRKEFAPFPWSDDHERLRRWQMGQTGFPIVDAGMRELWQTGWMHNRVRMIVASFLVKDLMIPWQRGADWFWDTLVDADLANNSASWQWVAGCGADAAPYFRIFNPVKQGQSFDPDGAYVRRYVPEISRLDSADIHAPWLASPAALAKAGITLGQTYPLPMVDHSVARAQALEAFQVLKTSG
jgi:deoxyribodipyrimidine photo-lyase